MNRPVRLTSAKDFTEVFGALDEAYLAHAVAGFFANGGRTCYVIRVAHMVSRNGEDVAECATTELPGLDMESLLTVVAKDEGEWGDRVRVQVLRPEAKQSTFLTLDIRDGDTSAVIKSSHGLVRGSVVRIYDAESEMVRIVTEVEGKTIAWSPSEPSERTFQSGAPTYVEPVTFDLNVRFGAVRESFQGLCMSPGARNDALKVVNRDSAFISLTLTSPETSVPMAYPAASDELKLSGGADGLHTVAPEDFIGANIGPNERYGLAAFESMPEVDLLVIPDLVWALEHSDGFRTQKDVWVVQDAMITQCERLKTRFSLLDFPEGSDHLKASQWRLLFDSAYAAFYFPWVDILGEDDAARRVPPSGHVAGVYARCDTMLGPFRAPANEQLEGIIDVGRDLHDADIAELNAEGINCLKPFNRRGIRVWGAKTVSSDPMWTYVPVRRVVNAVIAAVEQGLQWAVFENNDRFLWKRLTHQVTAFLLELWQQGFFKGANPEDAFYVKCDAETTPDALRDLGQVVVECGVAPVRPAEFIVFKVEAEAQATTTEE